MDTADREKIEKLISDRKKAHTFYSKHSGAYRAFLDLEHQAFKDGALPAMQKELVALGISVVIGCESCMEWHIRQALDTGATFDQLIETVGVGIEMGGGPATVSARFAMKVLEYYQAQG